MPGKEALLYTKLLTSRDQPVAAYDFEYSWAVVSLGLNWTLLDSRIPVSINMTGSWQKKCSAQIRMGWRKTAEGVETRFDWDDSALRLHTVNLTRCRVNYEADGVDYHFSTELGLGRRGWGVAVQQIMWWVSNTKPLSEDWTPPSLSMSEVILEQI